MGKTFLTEKAYRTVKDWIVHYQLKPGTSIGSRELADSLGMSQTPVREALSILEHERLVERAPKKGYIVRALDAQEVVDLYDLRIAVEVWAAEKAATFMGKGHRKKLTEILDRFPGLIRNGEKARIFDLEQRIHLIITEASGNRLLAETGKGILERIWMIQRIILFTSEHWDDSYRQHLEIFKAIKAGDVEMAAALMKKHLFWGKELVLSRLKDKDDFMSSIFGSTPDLKMN